MARNLLLFGPFSKMSVFKYNLPWIFLGNLWKIWATFHFNIWSHCHTLTSSDAIFRARNSNFFPPNTLNAFFIAKNFCKKEENEATICKNVHSGFHPSFLHLLTPHFTIFLRILIWVELKKSISHIIAQIITQMNCEMEITNAIK